MENKFQIFNYFLIFNRREWLSFGKFTEEELDNAREDGFIGKRDGVDCYITRHLSVEYNHGRNRKSFNR